MSGGRGPGVVAEVLPAGDQASATAASAPDNTASGPGTSGAAPASAQATATTPAVATPRTGLAIPTSSSGGGFTPGGDEPALPLRTATPRPGTPAAAATATPVATFDAGDATPIGHNSHLHMEASSGRAPTPPAASLFQMWVKSRLTTQ